MNEEIVNLVSKLTSLNPLDVILLTFIGTGIFAVWRFMLKESRDSTIATNNSTSMMKESKESNEKAMEMFSKTVKENTSMIRELKDEISTKLKKATRK